MPRYKVRAADGKLLTINAEDEAALDEAMREYESDGVKDPTSTDNQEIRSNGINNALGTAEKVGQGLGVAGAIGVPIAQIAAGAPALPVIGGVLGALGAGAATNYALEKTGIGPGLKKAGEAVTNVIPDAQTQSVPLNFLWQMLKQASPTGLVGNALSAAPDLASAYVAMKAGGGATNKLMPDRVKVPVGQEPQAMARTMQRMGIPIQEPVTNQPKDVMASLEAAKQAAGESVGVAKEAALQTKLSTPEIISKISEATTGGLKKAGVPVVGENLSPELAPGGPAPSKMVLEGLSRIGSIPPETPSNQTMKLANNVLEGLKKQVAESKITGSGVAGRESKGALSEWQRALDKLGPEESVNVARAADAVFSKLSTLSKMATKASKTRFGAEPSFNTRSMVFEWQNADPKVRAKFNPAEQKMLDDMVKQGPGWVEKLIMFSVNTAKKFGLKDLSFHPTARFFEPANIPGKQYTPLPGFLLNALQSANKENTQ